MEGLRVGRAVEWSCRGGESEAGREEEAVTGRVCSQRDFMIFSHCVQPPGCKRGVST